jgi:hypothetical protein
LTTLAATEPSHIDRRLVRAVHTPTEPAAGRTAPRGLEGAFEDVDVQLTPRAWRSHPLTASDRGIKIATKSR